MDTFILNEHTQLKIWFIFKKNTSVKTLLNDHEEFKESLV